MLSLAITGGLGAGKSTAAEFFRRRGAFVLDLDDVAAEVLQPRSATLARVADEFGDDILLPDGSLDRAALADRAFGDRESAVRLNAIVHPAVARATKARLDELRGRPDAPSVVVIEVPLLVEAPVFLGMADRVLAITAPESLRIARAVQRGMGPEEARRRLSAQAGDEERAVLADDVIANDGQEQEFLRRLTDYWERHVRVGEAG